MLTYRFPVWSLLLLAAVSNAQFTCTMNAQDEGSCVNSKGDDGQHCAWCSFAGFGACVSEDQAETMEQNIPGTQCDRYSGGDDDATNDDAVPSTDDEVTPSDDSLPDDYWTCLRKKDTKSCTSAGCTWCDSKQFGFGVCMTGPSAESAADSDFFECTEEEEETSVMNWLRGKTTEVEDPLDSACLMAFLQDPSEEGCNNAVDSEGNGCFFCSYQGFDLCLNEEQVEIGQGFGMECKEQKEENFNDPMDPTCLMAGLQDPTPDGCSSAVDADGNGCVFCTFQGTGLCLNQDQAAMGEQFGLECSEEEPELVAFDAQDPNPYDPTCAMAFLQDQDPAVCKSTVDMDGEPCKFCTLQGTLNLCLTEMQAEVGEGLGIECEEKEEEKVSVQDPMDPTCLMNFLQDPTPDGCNNSIDGNGDGCVFCSFQGTGLCLNQEQAAMGEQYGMECQEAVESELELLVDEDSFVKGDISDPTCLQAQLQEGGTMTPEQCASTSDMDGTPCEFCSMAGISTPLCLTDMQAQVAAQFGGECGQTAVDEFLEKEQENVELPPDFFDCLQNYDQDGCDNNGCTWCNSEVGVGFCAASPVARSFNECSFFDCDTRAELVDEDVAATM